MWTVFGSDGRIRFWFRVGLWANEYSKLSGMQKTLRALFCCWTLLICSSFQDPQIRVEVEAVNVLATVTDNKGRFIIDLT
ncbi:hypothetical protein MYX84_16550, partial [Acidobacteria bacterium AH-259-O06]|nr:hypothetical protein [Acidobacteria bacterium AH-259-O06]